MNEHNPKAEIERLLASAGASETEQGNVMSWHSSWTGTFAEFFRLLWLRFRRRLQGSAYEPPPLRDTPALPGRKVEAPVMERIGSVLMPRKGEAIDPAPEEGVGSGG